MIKEELVSIRTAKLAKEKGFDEMCNFIYNKDKQLVRSLSQNSDTSIRDFWFVAVPTQDLLRRWLREKFHIHVEVVWVDTLANIYAFKIITTGNAIRPISKHYYSYEEALEDGLREGLKLI